MTITKTIKTKLWEADFKRLVLRSGADGKFARARGPNDRRLDERDEAAMTQPVTDFADDALIDAYYKGYDAYRNGESLPYDDGLFADAWRDGKKHAQINSRVCVVLPAMAEGYYHAGHSIAGSPDAWRG